MEVQPLSAGVKGGLVGACAMALCAAIYGIVVQGSVWYPLNLLAAIAVPRMSDADLTTVIEKGKKPMPGYEGKLTKDQIADVVKYLRTLK